MLVFSYAQHVVTEEATLDIHNNSLTLNSPRITFQATVGRLSWTTDDLAKIYGHGLYFPLSDGKRHLVLGEEHVPVPQNTEYHDPTEWQTLVMANTQLSGTVRGDVVAYHLTAETSASCNCSRIPNDDCSIQISNYVTNVVERHIYSKDSVQPAYLATLFWLFQDAAVKEIATTTASKTVSVQLLFDGNHS